MFVNTPISDVRTFCKQLSVSSYCSFVKIVCFTGTSNFKLTLWTPNIWFQYSLFEGTSDTPSASHPIFKPAGSCSGCRHAEIGALHFNKS